MPARILIIDDIEANVRLLEAKMAAEYYEVLIAYDGLSGIAIAKARPPDLILLDIMMPGLTGYETCRRLKKDPDTRHIPILLVTALDGREDLLAGLEAGAEDFIVKPIDDMMLMARVKGQLRLKQAVDGLRALEASGRKMGVIASNSGRLGGIGGRVLVVDDNQRQGQRMVSELSLDHRPILETDFEKAMLTARGPIDLMIINLDATGFDGLRLVAMVRAETKTRFVPILAVMDTDHRDRVVKAMELGINDILARPIDTQELTLRVRTQIKRKRNTDLLHSNLDQSFELAVTDQLTGLHNRRYMTTQLSALVARALRGGEAVSVLMIDIDNFKQINDRFGHDVGDMILRDFSARLASYVRAVDLPCRFGGEEFVVLMPSTPLEAASKIAERIRANIAGAAFNFGANIEIGGVTVSIGLSCTDGLSDTPETLLKRADEALYEAKTGGRNRVIIQA
jgi:two-component system, cell cycle response regulator